MPNHIATLVTRFISVDERSKLITLSNIVETIVVNGKGDKPGVLQSDFTVFVFFSRIDSNIPEKTEAFIRYRFPDGTYGPRIAIDIDLSGNNLFSRSFLRVDQLAVKGPGEYRFFVELRDSEEEYKVVAECPIFIKFSG